MPTQDALNSLADRLDDLLTAFGGGSVAGTPAGSRTEGRSFEAAMGETWQNFLEMHQPDVELSRVRPTGEPNVVALVASNPAINVQVYLPVEVVPDSSKFPVVVTPLPKSWVQRKFSFSDMLDDHLGQRLFNFAPPSPQDSPNYWGPNYPKLYAGRTTGFDFTIALSRAGVLIEKMLFEYKYAKSTQQQSIDGNAHERLSFQVLHYLEIAQQYTYCSLNVILSPSYVIYKNKYPLSVNIE